VIKLNYTLAGIIGFPFHDTKTQNDRSWIITNYFYNIHKPLGELKT